ncbi:unnamed protein product [Lactuca saligna]|uniref:Trichome birefringence-like N-terminal domain-containing protein n=1 Tax=Lactuca saligna TaxID=75948 RepID=A0AA36EFA6_LACSI|nr:unnamed protein product [Lactuca saligna]
MLNRVYSASPGYFRSSVNWAHCKRSRFRSINRFNLISSCLFIVLAITCVYIYLYEAVPSPVILEKNTINDLQESNGVCDLYDGTWVVDETYPLYNASECPFAETSFNCLANGRRDKGYLKWKWKPKNCDIPRFNVGVILEKLRGKRIVFVGDSLSRTQWESMICLLMNGVEDKSSVYEVNRNKISKKISPKTFTKKGHWWNRAKLFEMGCYFKVGGRLKLGMSTMSAYTTALNTWASWVENTVDTDRTRVFFRTFEGSHWSGQNGHTCEVTEKPLYRSNMEYRNNFSDIIKSVVNNMSVPVTTMYVTPMGSFRSDAHVGTWSDNPTVPDCSHWCLPGLPDAWNQILFSYL